MSEGIINPLTEGDLEGAAYLCLRVAALTDRNQFPPGSGDMICRMYYERKYRFEQAQIMVREGIISLLKLGLFHEDCSWAASKANMAKDQEGWLFRFQTAESELRSVKEDALAQFNT